MGMGQEDSIPVGDEDGVVNLIPAADRGGECLGWGGIRDIRSKFAPLPSLI